MRLSPRELAVIDAGATAAEVTRATYMARAALAAAADPERTAALIASNREMLAELFAAHRTLRANGNLLNQAVKALHTGERPAQLDAAVALVQQAAEDLKNATGQFVALMNPQRPEDR
ncbi:mobilization protein [Streptomyces aculeolatus]|uniref:mobilization protein n=1 Tax=Streptomyces aculeolatus TaxID=270689 RepID=UPI001CEE0341|nr:mobilization protein [Streptomyces aculeolatus]